MRRDQRGFAPIALIVLIVIGIAVLGGVFYYFHKSPPPPSPIVNNPPVVATSTAPISTTPSSTTRGYLTPTSGPVGTLVTIHGSGFAAMGNTIALDGLVTESLIDVSSPDGKTLTFIVPRSLGPNCKPDQACPMYLILVTARSYNVSVISDGVTHNIGTFTVTGGVFPGPTPIPTPEPLQQ